MDIKRISILVYKDSFETAIFPTVDMLDFVNHFLIDSQGYPGFEINLVGYESSQIRLSKYSTVQCDHTIHDDIQHDLIIIPGVDERILQNLDWAHFNELTDWLVHEHSKGVEIGSMCLGAILLARTGLLDDRKCTTHWQGCPMMRDNFPDVLMAPSEVITQENGIYTSGGGLSSIQLTLFFIEKFLGKEVATYTAKMAGIDYPLKTQNQFYVFDQQKNHTDDAIIFAQDFMEQNYAEPIRMEDISRNANMSSRNFIRRFKKATGDTPIEYLQKIRIEAAKSALERGNSSVSEVMFNSGYQDMKSFRVLFKRMTGMTPSTYLRKVS